ncbi:MAG: hypothetical protein ACE369_07520 [Roseovarius sp.]
MKNIVFLVSALTVLSACGGSTGSGSSQPTNPAIEAAWSDRKAVSYKGNTFLFARNTENPVAYVQASNNDFRYTMADIEAVARGQTGCGAKMNAGVLEFIGGFGPDADLSKVNQKGKPFRWSVSLSC